MHSIKFTLQTMLTLMVQLIALSANTGHNQQYSIRPFNKVKDQAALEQICANVWEGTDYLPSIFKTYCDDPDCSFLALTDIEDRPLAVSNYRRIGSNIAWFEAIRTAEDARGKGYAKSLLQEMLQMAKDENRSALSCTVASNFGMIKVFQRCGLEFLCKLNMIDFSTCKSLPGWKKTKDNVILPQNLISALKLEDHIQDSAKYPNRIITIKNQLELDQALQRIHESGGTNFVPSLYSILTPSQLSSSLEKGLIFFIETSSASSGSKGQNLSEDIALLVLSRDDRISSLKSNWICSVSTNSHLALEAAVWHACFSSEVQEKLDGDVAFCLIFNDYDPNSNNQLSNFVSVLPLAKDPCVLYGIP